MEKIDSVLGTPWGRLFWLSAWLPTGHMWSHQFFFDHFEFETQITLSLFRQKIGIDGNTPP